MTSKKLGGSLMRIALFISQYFSKKLTCVSKDLKKYLLMKILKTFSAYICRQLKYHQHRIKSETGISSKIILSVFKFLTVSLNSTNFCSFGLVFSVSLIWNQMCTFYCPLSGKICTLPEGTDVHIRQYIHQKDLNLFLPLYYYAKVIAELEKTQTRNSTVL